MKITNRQIGYTLVEIPIAIFIIGLMLLLYAVSSNTVILNRHARNQDLATRIGSAVIEDLRGTAFNSLPLTGPASHPLLPNLPNGQIARTLTDVNSDLKEYEVNVSWREEGSSTTNSVSFTTLITRNGI